MNIKLTRIAAAMAAAFMCLPAVAKEYRSADVHPEDYPTVMAVKFMSDYIKQKTNGKDTIKVYTGNQLGGEKRHHRSRCGSARSTSYASTSRR